MSAPNPYEQAGRAAKVSALLLVLDAGLRAAEQETNTGAAAGAVGALNEAGWATAAAAAGVRPPSLTTRAEVIAVYLARALLRERKPHLHLVPKEQ